MQRTADNLTIDPTNSSASLRFGSLLTVVQRIGASTTSLPPSLPAVLPLLSWPFAFCTRYTSLPLSRYTMLRFVALLFVDRLQSSLYYQPRRWLTQSPLRQ